jgi:hypothetical protein
VISGDTLADFGRGLGIADWLRAGVTREAVAERLRPSSNGRSRSCCPRTEHQRAGPRSNALSQRLTSGESAPRILLEDRRRPADLAPVRRNVQFKT